MKIIKGASFWSDGLAIYLPCLDSTFVIHHIATKPHKHALTQGPHKSEKGKWKRSISTQLSTHFLTLTYDGLHVLALELLVYRSSPSTDQGETENRPAKGIQCRVERVYAEQLYAKPLFHRLSTRKTYRSLPFAASKRKWQLQQVR
ncbi:hypothetical protein POJ06DRAFT_251847 [Lipomyces tetrasporus]|uniref:Uncharacterized protein n=1 Tax=Lipomyces tetrasporus TaxID=54092 RepID=A0AAD7VU16_9ASCO|nr:uncharacterized protein POJ06DRAFT_251847 [Lipomyces tetrasporus]KAJ8101561.1 hypothetical protein POJ06DRAFT_251847 [Lipomyces tetrasporus]